MIIIIKNNVKIIISTSYQILASNLEKYTLWGKVNSRKKKEGHPLYSRSVYPIWYISLVGTNQSMHVLTGHFSFPLLSTLRLGLSALGRPNPWLLWNGESLVAVLGTIWMMYHTHKIYINTKCTWKLREPITLRRNEESTSPVVWFFRLFWWFCLSRIRHIYSKGFTRSSAVHWRTSGE